MSSKKTTATYDATVESLKAEHDAKRELAKTDANVRPMSMSERLAFEAFEAEKVYRDKKFAAAQAAKQERAELAKKNREEDRNAKSLGVLALGKEVTAMKTDMAKIVADAVKADRAESDKKLDALIAAMTAMMAAKA